MVAKRFYLVGIGAAVIVATVVAALMVHRSGLSRESQSGQKAESSRSNQNQDPSGGGGNVALDGERDGDARSATGVADKSSQNPVRTIADADEDSAEIKTALPGFHRTNDYYARGA